MINKKGLTLLVPWTLWALASLTYFYQYYLRVSVSSLSKHLIQDFFLTIVDVSNLAMLFFIAYVFALPIAGILLDRFGVKKMLPLAMIVAGASCFLFAWSHNDIQLALARVLMGVSTSFSLISALVIIRNYFKTALFPVLSGLTITISVLGGILGGGPLVTASDFESWRQLMGYAGWYAFVIAVLFYFIISEDGVQKEQPAGIKIFISDLKIFLRQGQNWLPGIYGGFILAPVIAFASFWAAPFLNVYYQISFREAEYLTSFIFVGYAVGAPISAILSQKFGLKAVMICFAGLAAIIMWVIVHFILPVPCVMLCLFLQGVAVGSYILSNVVIKITTAPDIAASGFSFTTMLSQLVGAILLWAVGQFIYLRHGVEIIKSKQVFSSLVIEDSMYLFFAGSCVALLSACLIKMPPKPYAEVKIAE